MEVESIARIRELEVSVLTDIKNSNSILEIKKTFLDGSTHQKVRLAALHSLRRMFRQFFEDGKFAKVKGDTATGGEAGGSKKEKLEKFRAWLYAQYVSVKSELLKSARSSALDMQVPAIRTVIEFACLEHEHLAPSPHMGVNTFHSLVLSLLRGGDIDIDVLLMLKDEIFSKQDCVYHAMRSIFKLLTEVKTQMSTESSQSAEGPAVLSEDQLAVVQNALDMLRLVNIAYPTDEADRTDSIDPSTFLLPPSSIESSAEDMSDDEEVSDDGDDDGDEEAPKSSQLAKKRGRYAKKRTLLADEGPRKKKRRANMARAEKLLDRGCHVKEFGRVWLLLFSLPLNKSQRRLALKHLPQHVIPHLEQPLLLADYLIRTVSSGGVGGVLALESLFQIIVQHNLDYPRFFDALYRMCNADVFAAKYRAKFTTLLHTSLKSTNLPAYTVAAFVKRLVTLAIKVPGPSASFCLAQSITLLRAHPQCLKLIHNSDKDLAGGDEYNAEVNDTSKSHAFSSSLHEVLLLQQHYIPELATLAQQLQNDPTCTTNSRDSRKNATFDMKKLGRSTYQELIEDSLKGSRGSAPLAFVPPKALFSPESIIGKCFGL